MSVESRIEASGRRLLQSPLWVGLLITAFLVIPTFLVPSVPLWVAVVSLITLTPLVLLSTYLVYFIYGRVADFRTDRREKEVATEEPEDFNSPIEQLQYRYAIDEIDEDTFERKLDRLLKTESSQQRSSHRDREVDLLKD